MAAALSNWIKRNVLSRYLMDGCAEEQKCLEVLEVILDNESTPEEEKEYFDHIQKCWTCFNNYNLESAIRELIKTRVERKQVPEDLIDRIRTEINKSSIE